MEPFKYEIQSITEIVELESFAINTRDSLAVAVLHSVRFYSQRAHWADIDIGLVAPFEIVLCTPNMDNIALELQTKPYLDTVRYLRTTLPSILSHANKKLSHQPTGIVPVGSQLEYDNNHRSTFSLTHFLPNRQSKLSAEQLTELQRSTHFDKKELQQWYKGMLTSPVSGLCY
jgi:hypothetical protein